MMLQARHGSVHTHSVLCDGKDTPAAMAEAAWKAGVRWFGFSGHSHTPIPHDEGNVLPADLREYRETVVQLRREYASRMEILLGLEQDSCSQDPLPGDLDYWIGSVHNLCDFESGRYYAVDWDVQTLQRCCEELCHGDFRDVIRRYYAQVAKMAEQKPTILGHIDLITKLNGDGRFFDENAPFYRLAALDALHAADTAATLLEINTGAMSRGCRSEPYPANFLLREWRAMGGQVILTADAHSADAVVYGYEKAAEVARSAGYQESVLLTGQGWQLCRL